MCNPVVRTCFLCLDNVSAGQAVRAGLGDIMIWGWTIKLVLDLAESSSAVKQKSKQRLSEQIDSSANYGCYLVLES